jgi:carbonic anhydrase
MTYDPFEVLLQANKSFAKGFESGGLAPAAAKGIAIITCMDSRIEPLAMLGLGLGDAKVIRNAGARVNDEVLASLVVARHLLGVTRTMVIAHTECRMTTEVDALHDAIRGAGGPDTSDVQFDVAANQEATLRADVTRIRDYRHLTGLDVGGFIYDVNSGLIKRVV